SDVVNVALESPPELPAQTETSAHHDANDRADRYGRSNLRCGDHEVEPELGRADQTEERGHDNSPRSEEAGVDEARRTQSLPGDQQARQCPDAEPGRRAEAH